MILWQNRGTSRQQPVRPKAQQNKVCRKTCPSGLEYLGNIFLLGLQTLVSELVDLQAATTLEQLLAPFQNDTGSNIEQDILATEIGDNLGGVVLAEVAEEQQGPQT
jgi:hypothetical protein